MPASAPASQAKLLGIYFYTGEILLHKTTPSRLGAVAILPNSEKRTERQNERAAGYFRGPKFGNKQPTW